MEIRILAFGELIVMKNVIVITRVPARTTGIMFCKEHCVCLQLIDFVKLLSHITALINRKNKSW